MANLTEKIIKKHLIKGEMIKGKPIEIKIDTTLTQDATGTMAYLELEAMGIDRVQTIQSVSYVDHNTLQSGFENADDHEYLRTVANRYGVIFSRPGNGICHQVQLERFDVPGRTLLGSDSHTPTAGAMGMIAIGAGGLDVALAMAGKPFALTMPEVINVRLVNRLNKGVAAKDIILKLLSILKVKGGVGRVIEYSGEGVKYLSIPERSTITNMGAELGATTSIFPSDEQTFQFLKKQNREADYLELKADDNAKYDQVIEIDLAKLEPLVACPHSPDNVVTVKSIEGLKVNQIAIGSCTNSSFTDLLAVANILKGKKIAPTVSLVISFGSKQVLRMLAQCNALDDIIQSGARILECTCGPCIGMGQSPMTNAVSLRTFNRNFYGRSGTTSAGIYLVSCETAALSAINGVLTSPLNYDYEQPVQPDKYLIDDSMLIYPDFSTNEQIIKGPNIKNIPIKQPISKVNGKILLKLEDNITTDHIMPAGAKILPYRSNIEKISEFCFHQIDNKFYQRALDNPQGIIIAKENYGQGSSREHAAMAPMFLKIDTVIALSFARIHRQNLINNGIVPLLFSQVSDYDDLQLMDTLEIDLNDLSNSNNLIAVINQKQEIILHHDLTSKEIATIKAGGILNQIK